MTDAPATSASRRFATVAGQVDASIDGEVVRARGIRYARATRFGLPVAEPPSVEPIDATRPGPACVQTIDPPGALRVDGLVGLELSEDCLRVSVTAPADVTPDEGLPVMVWIHGGAYRNGAADSALYDPAPLVREHRVVVASIGYRLGPLGYLGGEDRPANLGLLDQREGLRWVRRNIATFGGDPDQVTVYGESAGADAIAHLMISDGVICADGVIGEGSTSDGAPLFRRAILQSAPLGTVAGRARMAAAQAQALLELPADGTLPTFAVVDAAVAASGRSAGLAGMMPYGVQYGHDPLPPASEADRRWREVAPYVDVLAGTNAREIALYRDTPPFPTLRRVRGVGPALTEVAVQTLTRLVFERPTTAFVRRHQRAGGRARQYRFFGGVPGNPLQAAHAGELPYLFAADPWASSALLDGTSVGEVDRLGRGMRQLWAEFAKTGVADDGAARELLRLV